MKPANLSIYVYTYLYVCIQIYIFTLCLFEFRGLSLGTHTCTAGPSLTSLLFRLPLLFEGAPGTAYMIPKYPTAVSIISKESLLLTHPAQMMLCPLWPRSPHVLQPLHNSNSILFLYSAPLQYSTWKWGHAAFVSVPCFTQSEVLEVHFHCYREWDFLL